MNEQLNNRLFIHNLYNTEKRNVKEASPSYIDQAQTVLWLIKDQPIELRKEACKYFSELTFYKERTMLEMIISYNDEFMKQYYSDIIQII